MKYISTGIEPKTKSDFLKYLYFSKNSPNPKTLTPGYTRFEKNGFFIDTGGPQNFWPVIGKWEINEKDKIFILKIYGKSYINNSRNIRSISELKKYKKFKKIKIYKIPFKRIRLNIKGFISIFYLNTFWKYRMGIIGNRNIDGITIKIGETIQTN